MTHILANLFDLDYQRNDLVKELSSYQSPEYKCDNSETALTEDQSKKQDENENKESMQLAKNFIQKTKENVNNG